MNEEATYTECLEMIEDLFERGEDVSLPHAEGVEGIVIVGSEPPYTLSTVHGMKRYPDAEAVLQALIQVERLTNEDDALWGVHQDLSAVS